MTKKKKKKSLKEKRRLAALKRERASKAARVRVEREIERKHARARGKIYRRVFVVICLVALVFISYGVWQSMQTSTPSSTESQSTEPTEPQPPPSPNENEAPSFTLTDIDGETFSLSDFRGSVVVLDFFATWCTPCVAEMPHLAEIHEKYGSDVVITSIAPSTDTVELLKQFREDHNMLWRIARDTAGVSDDYGVQYIPTLVIIDQSGIIYYRNEGLTDASTLSSKIDSLLGP